MLRLKEPHPATPKELLEAYDRIPSPTGHATQLIGKKLFIEVQKKFANAENGLYCRKHRVDWLIISFPLIVS